MLIYPIDIFLEWTEGKCSNFPATYEYKLYPTEAQATARDAFIECNALC